MKLISISLAASLLILGAAPALAQAPAAAASDSHSGHHAAPAAPSEELSEGEIKNLDMPAMTMVFRVSDASVLGDLKAGDKVRFRAERVNGTYQVTRIEKAP